MRTIAHVTHEAVEKVGGIGAVLEGLLTCDAYRNREHRTILIGPMFATRGGAEARLGSAGEVLYSSVDGVTRHPVSAALDHVRRDFHVGIAYGHRTFSNPHTGMCVSPEIVLIDVSRMDLGKTNAFKRRLWEAYGLESSRYEHSWEYDLYVKLAEPALAVLRALGATDHDEKCVILAHEFMGLPTALAARLDPSGAFRTVFYAHEVSAMRRIVEDRPGHDVSFYNALSSAIGCGRYVDDVFGPQDGYYRHALVKAARHCDRIFAVGDYVVKELRFIGPEFADAQVDTTYNGVPAEHTTLAQKRDSQRRLRDYAETLLGDRPDYLFTHVTRTAPSKGLWRDLRVLEHVEAEFRRSGKSAVLFLLSTEVSPRRSEDVRDMERQWHWPVAHREGGSDLSAGEAIVYQGIQEFNARSRRVKIVYVNQFGWERDLCGNRMSPDMELMDIRRGSDVEFGQSIYEPFGISQLEPLTFGGICLMSQVCGCTGLVEAAMDGKTFPNVIIADYCDLGPGPWDEQALLAMDCDQRERHEQHVAGQAARRLLEVLPTDDASADALLDSGYQLAREMSWEVVASRHILPAIDAICRKPGQIRAA